LYPSPTSIKMITLLKDEMGGECSTYVRDDKCGDNFTPKHWKISEYVGDLLIDGKIILKRILREYDATMWTGFIWLKQLRGLLWIRFRLH